MLFIVPRVGRLTEETPCEIETQKLPCSRYAILKKIFILRSVESNTCTASRTMGMFKCDNENDLFSE